MLKVLTVGDGDFSLSLSLLRAYSGQIELTATTLLPSLEALIDTYKDAAHNVDELLNRDTTVLYGVDAARLHTQFPDGAFDWILFHHPHLGDYHERDETVHLQRHFTLIAHYLASASMVINSTGNVHLALCGHQSTSWRLLEAAEKASLHLCQEIPVFRPFHQVFGLDNVTAVPESIRKGRQGRGKYGNKHWLVRYGYQHQRTFVEAGKKPVDLSGGTHYVFRRTYDWKKRILGPMDDSSTRCCLCGELFESAMALGEHWRSPSQPQTVPLVQPIVAIPSPDDNRALQEQALSQFQHGETKRLGAAENRTPTEISHTLSVDKECEGKRLRWYLQHTIKSFSRKKVNSLIESGHVQVNRQIALDTSRILRGNDIIHIFRPLEHDIFGESLAIEIRDQWDDTIVVWKPVGMRTRDAPQSLEDRLSQQEKKHFVSLSKLDTGCSGLCLFVTKGSSLLKDSVQQITFTALVHGQYKATARIKLPVGKLRRWNLNSTEEVVEATIYGVESAAELSTISIGLPKSIASPASVIGHYLRTMLERPVVGDRFSGEHYLRLPRPVRNKLKHRLCFACTELQFQGKAVIAEIPDRYRASYWNQFFDDKT